MKIKRCRSSVFAVKDIQTFLRKLLISWKSGNDANSNSCVSYVIMMQCVQKSICD